MDVVTALSEGLLPDQAKFTSMPRIVGGRYGLSSKEFTPAMALASICRNLRKVHRRTISPLVLMMMSTNRSLDFDPEFCLSDETVRSCVFIGLGSDGTVGANHNSIRIIGEETDNFAQGYFYYDSKKSGTVTISHLRFGPRPIRAPYLVGTNEAQFVACHQFYLCGPFRYAQVCPTWRNLPAK